MYSPPPHLILRDCVAKVVKIILVLPYYRIKNSKYRRSSVNNSSNRIVFLLFLEVRIGRIF